MYPRSPEWQVAVSMLLGLALLLVCLPAMATCLRKKSWSWFTAIAYVISVVFLAEVILDHGPLMIIRALRELPATSGWPAAALWLVPLYHAAVSVAGLGVFARWPYRQKDLSDGDN